MERAYYVVGTFHVPLPYGIIVRSKIFSLPASSGKPPVKFELFDPSAEFDIRYGNMPHWFQTGATYFVTFRTADSIPQDLARNWRLRRDTWLRQHGIEPTSPDWKQRLQRDPELNDAFRAMFIPEFMEWLDRSYGERVLRREELATIVAESLCSGDGDRYHLATSW